MPVTAKHGGLTYEVACQSEGVGATLKASIEEVTGVPKGRCHDLSQLMSDRMKVMVKGKLLKVNSRQNSVEGANANAPG
jgi:hypothetical protein